MSPTDPHPVSDVPLPLGQHLLELRKAVVYPLVFWFVGAIVGIVFQGYLIEALLYPVKTGIRHAVRSDPTLLRNSPGIASPRASRGPWQGPDGSLYILRTSGIHQIRPERTLGWQLQLSSPPVSSAMSPDGQLLAVASLNGDLVLVETSAGRMRWISPGLGARQVDFLRDGQGIVVESGHRGLVLLGLDGVETAAWEELRDDDALGVGQPLNVAPLAVVMIIMKAAIIFGLVVGFPFMAWSLWQFVRPGLYPREQKLIRTLLVSVSVLFLLGAAFAYFAVVPLVARFLYQFNASYTVVIWDIGKYVDLTMAFLIGFGVVFETPLVILLITWLGIVTPDGLASHRRMVWLLTFIVSAVLTPPDPFSQTLMAVPAILLFEVGILVSRIVLVWKRDRTETPAAHPT